MRNEEFAKRGCSPNRRLGELLSVSETEGADCESSRCLAGIKGLRDLGIEGVVSGRW